MECNPVGAAGQFVDRVTSMEGGELLGKVALHAFVPVFVGALVYRFTASKLLAAIWTPATLALTIFADQVFNPKQETPPGPTVVNPPPRRAIPERDPDLPPPTPLEQATELFDEYRGLIEQARNITSRTALKNNIDALKARLDVLNTLDLDDAGKALTRRCTNIHQFAQSKYNLEISESERFIRDNLSEHYISIRVAPLGNCLFRCIALTNDEELLDLAEQLYRWMEIQEENIDAEDAWEMTAEMKTLERKLKLKALKLLSPPHTAWSEKYNQVKSKTGRAYWEGLLDLCLVPGMIEARQKTREHVKGRLDEVVDGIWNAAGADLSGGGTHGLPLYLQEIYRERLKAFEPLEKISLTFKRTLAANYLLNECNDAPAGWEGNSKDAPLAAVMAHFGEEPDKVTSLKLITEITQGQHAQFVEDLWLAIKGDGLEQRPEILRTGVTDIQWVEDQMHEEGEKIQHEVAEAFADALLVDGHPGSPEDRRSPMWGTGVAEFVLDANPPADGRENVPLMTDRHLPEELPKGPVLFNAGRHYWLLIDR